MSKLINWYVLMVCAFICAICGTFALYFGAIAFVGVWSAFAVFVGIAGWIVAVYSMTLAESFI